MMAGKKPRLREGRYPKIHYNQFDIDRVVIEPPNRVDERSAFERDRSRIVHSASFRRLQGKTQVFAIGEGDFFRTRLTHSLEVAQVGKGLALRLGADPDLVEAVCLAHDIGHPPFGHAGEAELNLLMDKFGGFEANAQNLRLLTRLEQKSTNYDGINLTRASLDGQLKYKVPYAPGAPKFYFVEDQETVLWAGDGSFPDPDSKSFECQIMDWADDIAYAVHDLEDGIHSGFVNSSILSDGNLVTNIMEETFKKLSSKLPSLKSDEVQNVWVVLNQELRRLDGPLGTASTYQQRKRSGKMLTSQLIGRYIKSTNRVERPGAGGGVKSERYLYEVSIPDRSLIEVSLINRLVWHSVMRSPQVMTLEAKFRQFLKALFKLHMQDDGFSLLPNDWRELTSPHASPENRARLVSDYLSGMTDDYAQKLYSRLYLPDHGTVFDKM